MGKANISWVERKIDGLLESIERGEIGLPEFQRGWRWDSSRVRNFIDSLYRGYPTGILLFWRPSDPTLVNLKEFLAEGANGTPQYLILDGQQRLSALWRALVKGEIKIRFHPLLEAFEIENAANRRSREWLPIWEAMWWSAATINKEVRERFPEEQMDAAIDAISRLQDIRRYEYRICIVETDDYETVVECFVRLNSGGVRLRQAELAMASLLLGVPGFYKDRVEGLLSTLRDEMGFDVDITFIMRCFGAILTGDGRLASLRRKLKEAGEKEIREAWKGMEEGLLSVVSDLRSEGLERRLVPSINVLIPLVFYRAQSRLISERERRLLRAWFHLASAKRRYAGAVESTLSEDLRALREQGPEGLFDLLRRMPGGTEVTEEELEGPRYSHPYMAFMFAVIRERGGRDLFTGDPLTPIGPGPLRVEFHHIFPRSFLVKTLRLSEREADELANIAFLTQSSNRYTSNNPPRDYLGKIERGRLEAQLIPTNPYLWEGSVEAYRGFLRERRRLLVKAMNDFISSLS